jgi:hypothetical protein
MTALRWREAMAGIEVRHPNGRSRAILRVDDGDPPSLYVGVDLTWCTLTGEPKYDFAISTVRLMCSASIELARKWVAAAWAGYCQHEALELVTLADDRSAKVLDPHAEPYVTNPFNRGLRAGFPAVLTPETMLDTLALVMPIEDAERLMGAG